MTNKKSECGSDPRSTLQIIIVIITVIFSTVVAPIIVHKYLEKDTDLSCSIEGPKYIMNPEDRSLTLNTSGFSTELIDVDKWSPSGLTLNISGFSTSSLFEYNVRIWNSGDVPLKDLPICFVFDTSESDFKIFNATRETNPEYEFGEIEEQDINAYTKRFIYSLLNPNDDVTHTFRTNCSASLNVFAKTEGVSLRCSSS